jgi:hypothetical protein
MIYRTIMVQLDVDAPVRPRIQFAWNLAQRFEADLIGLAACQPHQLMVAADGAVIDGELMRRQMEEIERRLEEMKEEFANETDSG